MPDDRVRLPARRLRLARALNCHGVDLLVEVGFDRAGTAREIFVEGLQYGGDLHRLVNDAAILVSHMLQSGWRAEELFGKLMGADTQTAAQKFADAETGAVKPSLIAQLVAAMVRIEIEDGDAVRCAYECAAQAGRL